MNLKQFETFIWVATLGSFRKAAQKLNTSQPAISSRIAALEETLGVKLFERQAGRFELTAKGFELLPYAQKLWLQTERFKERACETSTMSGILRLGVSETIVHTWLSDFLRQAHQNFPNVDIEIMVDITASMRNELVSRSLDLAFLLGPISEYSIQNLELCSFKLSWVCAGDYDLPKKGPVPLHDLLSKPIMTYARNTRPFAEVQAKVHEEDVEDIRLFPSTSLAASIRMAVDGLGIGMLPESIIQGELARGELRVLEADWLPSDLVFTASYPREPFNPIAQKLAEMAAQVATTYQQT